MLETALLILDASLPLNWATKSPGRGHKQPLWEHNKTCCYLLAEAVTRKHIIVFPS